MVDSETQTDCIENKTAQPRGLHLNIPSSPLQPSGECKVTDMSLGSDGSSNKTPGSGFELKSKSFSTLVEEGQEEGLEAAEGLDLEDENDTALRMKRSASSNVEEEDEDINGQNNNNEYTQESSDDNLLESLDRKVCLLWEKRIPTGEGVQIA